MNNEAVEVAVSGAVHLDHSQSIRQLNEASGVSRSYIIRILRTNKFHHYKVTLLPEINEDDPDGSLQFPEQIQCLIEIRTYYLTFVLPISVYYVTEMTVTYLIL